MTLRDDVREMIAHTGRSMRSVSVAMGKNANYVAAVLDRETMHVSTLQQIASECGYDVCLTPRGGGESIVMRMEEE